MRGMAGGSYFNSLTSTFMPELLSMNLLMAGMVPTGKSRPGRSHGAGLLVSDVDRVGGRFRHRPSDKLVAGRQPSEARDDDGAPGGCLGPCRITLLMPALATRRMSRMPQQWRPSRHGDRRCWWWRCCSSRPWRPVWRPPPCSGRSHQRLFDCPIDRHYAGPDKRNTLSHRTTLSWASWLVSLASRSRRGRSLKL